MQNASFLRLFPPRAIRLLAVLIVLTCLLGLGHAPQKAQAADTIRVAAPDTERVMSSLSPFGQGFELDLLALFSRKSGMNLEWVEVDTPEQAWQALADGSVDLVVGLGDEPPEWLKGPIQAGPAYAHYKPVLVITDGAEAKSGSICEDPVLMTANPTAEAKVMEPEDVTECEPRLSVSPEMELEPILESLDMKKARYAIVEDGRYKLWQPFFRGVREKEAMAEEIPYRWYWRLDKPEIMQAILGFWTDKDTHEKLKDLTERYFGFLPGKTDYFELEHISRTISKKFPLYGQHIVRESVKNDIDPLFLAAVIYQESRFRPNAESYAGARGLMQITAGTAKMLNVSDRNDPSQSITGGSRYLRQIWDSLDKYDLDPWDRWLFTLAGYNQGPGHLYDAIDLAKRLGGTGKTWRELKEVFPLLAKREYSSQAKYGRCRGKEAVIYVDKVRYYYYVLRGLVILARPEAEHLGPLVGDVPADWPIL